jgi:hypothetical protein
MPRVLEAKKDVISCDKPGGEANTHYIPGFPNGETRLTEGQTPFQQWKGANAVN